MDKLPFQIRRKRIVQLGRPLVGVCLRKLQRRRKYANVADHPAAKRDVQCCRP
jgi:hypothetical protein